MGSPNRPWQTGGTGCTQQRAGGDLATLRAELMPELEEAQLVLSRLLISTSEDVSGDRRSVRHPFADRMYAWHDAAGECFVGHVVQRAAVFGESSDAVRRAHWRRVAAEVSELQCALKAELALTLDRRRHSRQHG